MKNVANIVILTGAGISAESGLRTFRADDGHPQNGLWEDHPVDEVATPEGFAANPGLVQRFYDARRADIQAAQPNAAHRALARLDAEWPRGEAGELLIVTQNIDDLHERAADAAGLDIRRVLHMHGEALSAWCTWCDARHRWRGTLADAPACPRCGQRALRPDIVWFGETPYWMGEILGAISRADLFVSIGTSGAVYPAAGFVADAASSGARTLELNLERSAGSHRFSETRLGLASEMVPEWVEEVLGG